MVLFYFAFTLFVSAFLLFLVQPMIGKMILPRLGGTPQVWNTCMLFFQIVLLAGYSYTHSISTWLKPRQQMIVHGLMHDEHVLTQVAGHNMDVIKILPPLTITDKEIDLFVNGLDRVLDRCGSPIGPMWTFGTNLARHALAAKKARAEAKPATTNA